MKRTHGSFVRVADEKPTVSEFPSTDVSLSPFAWLYNSTLCWPTGKIIGAYCHFVSPIGKKGRCCNERKKEGKKNKKWNYRSKANNCERGKASVAIRPLDSKMTPLTYRVGSRRSLECAVDVELSPQLRKIAPVVITVVFQVLKATYRQTGAVISHNKTDHENFQSTMHYSFK